MRSPPPMSEVTVFGELGQDRIHQARLVDADDGHVLVRSVVRFILILRFRDGVLLLAQLLDLAGQLGSAAVDARLDRALRQVQLVGDLLVGQFLDVAQHHRRAQRRRQLVERLARSRRTRSRCSSCAYRRGGPAPPARSPPVDVAVDRLALLADAAVVIDAEIAADADQPRLEVGAAIERVERLVQLEEDVLREILGLIVPADELVGDVEDLAPIQADDRSHAA